MDKIVDKGIKIDLHIHSIHSKNKDGDKVKNNSIQNIGCLIKKLNEHNVEMCAITDHDTFNYDIYKTLKDEENKDSTIKKVLPGIEFSVNYQDDTIIHIVTIFNDSENEKVKAIQELFENGIGKTLYNKKGYYLKDDYYKILREINLDFVMIAHQKKSPTSTQKANKADVMSLGKDTFNELLFMEYFDAYEFRDKSNEVHNKRYGIEHDAIDKLRFITGTDCHDWPSYPKYNENTNSEANFTYIKALPTFKGLAMAITDYHRINYVNNFFGQGKYVESIEMNIDEQKLNIPLSKGINVIIGDNSIGKSLLLNAITDNRALSNKQSLKKGYDRYLKENNIEIKTIIPEENIFKYNYQGEIREIFDDPNMKSDKHLLSFFPDSIDASKYRKIVENEFKRLYRCIEEKFLYDERVQNLVSFKIVEEEPLDKELIIGNKIKSIPTKEIKNLISSFEEIITKMKEDVLKNKELREDHKIYIQSEIEFLETIKDYYKNIKEEKLLEKNKINIFNTRLGEYKEKYSERQTDETNQYNDFIDNKRQIIEDVITLVQKQQNIKTFEFDVEEIEVIPEQNPVDTYLFVSKIGVEKINNKYMNDFMSDILKKNEIIDIPNLNRTELKHIISRYPNDIEDALEGLKLKIDNKLNEDFKIKQTVTENSKDIYKELSDGFNSRIYFRLLVGDERNKGIYMIDQPEDHISQKAIKEDVLEQFIRMSKKRQIIMVTHNPQFIVNLDVDNVIFISKQDDKIVVQSGALEYENSEYNILKIVADNIDGGLTTIRERMKKYDKDIQI